MTPALRNGVGVVAGLFGGFGVMFLVITMNRMDRTPVKPPEKKEISFDVPEKRKAPPTRKPRPKPRPKPTPKNPPPPIPQIAQAVGGVDVGLWAGSVIDLSDGANSLLGDASNVVMTADTVDSLPERQSCQSVQFPASARNKGITGSVTLSMDFDARGGLSNVKILNETPVGVFGDTALRTARGCSFRPATFQGKPVPVSGVEWTIDFDLER